jgi:hypothetical protein
MHRILRDYKDEALARCSAARSAAVAWLSDLLGSFLGVHGRCLELLGGGPFDLVTAVPGTRPRRSQDRSPLHGLGGASWDRGVLVRGPGPLGHLRPSADAFALDERAGRIVRGKHVLLVDDTLTTGAHAQSAALSLRRAGARSVVVAVLARALRPHMNETAGRYLASARPLHPDRCCLCSPSVCSPGVVRAQRPV